MRNLLNKKIKLFWYKLDKGYGNFGDEINPYLLQKLTNKEVEWTSPYYGSLLDSAKSIIFMLFVERKSFLKVRKSTAWNRLFNLQIILAIGSMIRYADVNVKVWGAGIITKDENIPKAKFLAVRGKYTQKRLHELGYQVPDTVGDPAILLPLVFSKENIKKFKVGIIPHHFHYDFFKEKFSNNEISVIDLLLPVEKIISSILECEITLCTSLHGIIVSHTYGIPSIWIFSVGNVKKRSGDDIKFADYFSSVHLKEYLPIELKIKDLDNLDDYIQYVISNYSEILLPREANLITIRKKLLCVAPFKILKKYRI